MKKEIFVFLMLMFILSKSCKPEIAQWRGPDRNGIYQESALMDQWPEEGLLLLWEYEGLGRGYAAAAVSENIIFVNGEQDGKSYLYALDLDGKLLWKSSNGNEFVGEGFSSTYPGARSTPTLYGKEVYATSGQGRIACYDAASGEEKWAKSIVDNLDGNLAYFGYSESLAVDKDHVYCFPGGVEKNIVAMHRETGELAWASEALKDTFAYGSPVLVDLPEKEILITTSRHNIMVLDRSTGDLLASSPLEGYEYDGEHCNSVIYEGGAVYFVGNDTEGQGALKLVLSDDGKSLNEKWRNPEILNNFGGFVLAHESLTTTMKGNKLLSLNTENGQVVDSLKVATGSIAFADDKFFCYGQSGVLTLVKYEDHKMSIAGTHKVKGGSGQHFSHPVLSDGVLYIRHGNSLMAYKVGLE